MNNMNYKIRKLEIENKKEAYEEFSKIGATEYGQKIMAKKLFPVALKVKDIDVKAANILKQEMLARGGDVVTSRETLLKVEGTTDVIILGSIVAITSLAEKMKSQPFGLKNLSALILQYLDLLEKESRKKIIKIGSKEFDLKKEGVLIMGILNVTPDSFFDGGKYINNDEMQKRILQIVQEGAHIIDIGGLSTRPGSKPVSIEEEIKRVIPAVKFVKRNFNVAVSVDTYRSEVARQAIFEGADLINDISGLTFDEKLIDVVVNGNTSVVIMHIKGDPETMQNNPYYEDVIEEIYNFLYTQSNLALKKGQPRQKIIIDPGIGFGKTLEHNLKILAKIKDFKNMGFPVLIGTSRKSFIGTILNPKNPLPPDNRLIGSISSAVCSFLSGADILRVHDIAQTIEALKIAISIKNAI